MDTLCQQAQNSCSACCGLYNLRLNPHERTELLDKLTEDFLKLDITDSYAVYRYRCSVEPMLRSKAILNDVYICPFIGWVDKKKQKTGCLLHPQGSPHSDIHILEHPQSHSFYGESICSCYECISRNREAPSLPKGVEPLLYGNFVANHNLIKVIQKIGTAWNVSVSNLTEIVLKYLKRNYPPVTSFEMDLTVKFYTNDELWSVLGTLLDPDSYGKEAFIITEKGIKTGEFIKAEVYE